MAAKQINEPSSKTVILPKTELPTVQEPLRRIEDVTKLGHPVSYFRLSARIVDYFPLLLEDFAIRRCTTASCKKKSVFLIVFFDVTFLNCLDFLIDSISVHHAKAKPMNGYIFSTSDWRMKREIS